MGSSPRRGAQAKAIQRLFLVVEGTTSSITSGSTRTGITPPNRAGRVYNVFISDGSVRAGGASIENITLTNGEIASVDVLNGATAQTVTLAWTFFGNF